MIRWPATLPRPMRAPYGVTAGDGRQATRPETGPPRVRRRFSSAAATMQMTIDVDADQRMRFWRFWTEDTRGGSLPFLMPDWATDGLALTTEGGLALTTEDGTILTLSAVLVVMFSTQTPPSETPSGVRWRLAFPLSIMP